MTLSSPSNATLGTARTVAFIIDNDDTPTVSVAGAVALESDNVLRFPITMSAASGETVSVSWRTHAGSASPGVDFESAEGILSIPAGTVQSAISIGLLDDAISESNETFTMELSKPIRANLSDRVATGTISDDETQPTLAIDSSVVNENDGTVKFTISLSNISTLPVTVDYTTVSGTAGAKDFVGKSGSVTLAAGQASASVLIAITDDQTD